MAAYTQAFIDTNFATGMIRYADEYPGQKHLARIVISAAIENKLSTQFVVDTGAPWCILDPELAQATLDAVTPVYSPQEKICIRGITYMGTLSRMSLILVAEEGDAIAIEATVFIPTLQRDEVWSHPNFIGLDGFLSRIRFAIDPQENAFYFGMD